MLGELLGFMQQEDFSSEGSFIKKKREKKRLLIKVVHFPPARIGGNFLRGNMFLMPLACVLTVYVNQTCAALWSDAPVGRSAKAPELSGA